MSVHVHVYKYASEATHYIRLALDAAALLFDADFVGESPYIYQCIYCKKSLLLPQKIEDRAAAKARAKA